MLLIILADLNKCISQEISKFLCIDSTRGDLKSRISQPQNKWLFKLIMNLASWGNISIFKSTISRGKQSNVLLYREKCKWLFGSNHPEDKNNRKDFERKYRSHSRRHYFHWPWKICKNFSYFINQLIKHFISPAVTERKNPPPTKNPQWNSNLWSLLWSISEYKILCEWVARE